MRTALAELTTAFGNVLNITIDIDDHAADALRDLATLERHKAIQCAVMVLISGFFEAFLKDVAESFVADVCARGVAFTRLPDKMQRAHYVEGGNVLSGKASNRPKLSWMTGTPQDMSRRLASAESGTVPYDLVWEAFADVQANPGPEAVKQFLGRFGLTDVWRLMADKCGVSASRIPSQLESIIALRNECAHAGTAVLPPSPSEIRDYCSFVEQLATAIVQVLEDHLVTIV